MSTAQLPSRLDSGRRPTDQATRPLAPAGRQAAGRQRSTSREAAHLADARGRPGGEQLSHQICNRSLSPGAVGSSLFHPLSLIQ